MHRQYQLYHVKFFGFMRSIPALNYFYRGYRCKSTMGPSEEKVRLVLDREEIVPNFYEN